MDYAAGIDIGGTNTAIGLVGREGVIAAETSFATREYPFFTDYVDRIVAEVDRLQGMAGPEARCIGIGIGAPNANHRSGCIEQPANLRWRVPGAGRKRRFLDVLPVVESLQARFPSMSICMTNDAKAAAVGEMVYGGARGMRDFIVITLGTGLGSGFVINGELVYGHDGLAGELGHVVVNEAGRGCGCGRKGCLETYVSATGIKRTVFNLLADTTTPSRFRKVSFDRLDAKMITDAALAGDPLAIEAFEYTGKMLGQALADAVAVTSPEAIFLFGGLARAGEYLLEPTRRHMEAYMLRNFGNKVKLLLSELAGRNAAVLGAAALVWKQSEEKRF